MSILLPIVPNEVFDSAELGRSSKLGKFELCQDQQFGFYFNSEYQSVQYNSDKYQNEQAHSQIFVQHLQTVVKEIISRFGQNLSVVEVGCGKGYFFGMLSDQNFASIRGFDRTYQGNDQRILKRYVNSHDAPLNADVLVLRHVLEHVQNPFEFLNELAEINGKRCNFVIEVPSTDWIIDNSTYWDFTYEHVNYFTSESFHRLFGQCEVVSVFGEQYLLAFCSSDSLRARRTSENSGSNLLNEMIGRISENSLFDFAFNHSGRYWIWGGATKGILISYHLLCFDNGSARHPEGIVDINPEKQNRFSAATGIPIFSPESLLSLLRDGDKIFVANPAYEHEVTEFVSEGSTKRVKIEVLS
jgi:hypothetical protein